MYVDDGIIKAMEVASYPDDPAGDDKPDVTLADIMLSHIPELPLSAKTQALAQIEIQ
jgi:hypothetical protein